MKKKLRRLKSDPGISPGISKNAEKSAGREDYMNIPIKNKTGDILFEYDCENNTLKVTVEIAIKKMINLRDADLGYANLRDADLRYADLSYADLKVKEPPLTDRTFVSEILWRNAETETQKDFAARILREKRCWKYFYELAQEKQLIEWAEGILNKWKVYEEKIKEIKK